MIWWWAINTKCVLNVNSGWKENLDVTIWLVYVGMNFAIDVVRNIILVNADYFNELF